MVSKDSSSGGTKKKRKKKLKKEIRKEELLVKKIKGMIVDEIKNEGALIDITDNFVRVIIHEIREYELQENIDLMKKRFEQHKKKFEEMYVPSSDELVDLCFIAGIEDCNSEIFDKLSDTQKKITAKWLGRNILRASDNIVRVPNKPLFLPKWITEQMPGK